ncbi:chemotaxis protein CheW [Bowmanella sp. Y26]|uniref:chemotaxis protein CheA n=1 Tax=Bowmanella yangjiangensis TaxID=2811230 RepID=UPI001BDC370F|nr:chemotaxis protein CheW [Bowmanella yangjiangensis]MBT1065304.1 chemotaxis protein CheW [Bowmanella yangjiangensis]
MSIEMEQFHNVFFEESQEHLDEMEQHLMELDIEQPDKELLNSIFRAAHSIKGGSGIFGFDALTGLTHVMENLLDRARKDSLTLTSSIVDVLLSTVDILKGILHSYRTGGDIDWSAIAAGTEALDAVLGASAPLESQTEGYGLFEQPLLVNELEGFGLFADELGAEKDEGFGFFAPPDEPVSARNEDEQAFGLFEPLPPASEKPAEAETAQKQPEEKSAPQPLSKSTMERKGGTAAGESTTIRVDTQKIDALVNLVGELVITQSMLSMISGNDSAEAEERRLAALAELERNTREIQEAVMSMRMLPMSFVFNRFPRLVRDLSGKLGKSVELCIEGGSTEIDKGLIEKLVDPLTHLVRNSIDHGIEKPQRRTECGKNEEGLLTLRAAHKGGSILISIIDDGAGLNRERILAKAYENSVYVPEHPSDTDVWNLIFAPGFSTAAEVTDVSGRGVGMDVVRRNIEALGGRVEIESEQGRGAAFHIRLPLTLAILDGMCVAVDGQVYVVPLVNIIESIQPQPEQIKSMGNDKLLWVRDEYWPLLQLGLHMGVQARHQDATQGIVVLIESAKKRFGLLVDSLVGQQQVVIKSLEQHYKRVAGVAGATIMGDGSVALIIDVESLSSKVKTAPQLVREAS